VLANGDAALATPRSRNAARPMTATPRARRQRAGVMCGAPSSEPASARSRPARAPAQPSGRAWARRDGSRKEAARIVTIERRLGR